MRRQSDLNDIYGVKSIQSNPLEKDNDVPETGFRHSDSYHRFFRGYTEIRREKPNGRFSVERYYTQPWIVSTASARGYWLTRLAYACLVCLSWILYIRGMCMDLESNRAWFVVIPGFPAVLLMVLLSITVLRVALARKRMTLWDFESGPKRLRIFSLLAGGSMVLTAAVKTAHLVTYGGNTGSEVVSAGLVLLAAAGAGSVFLLERRAAYTTIPNDTVLPEGEAHEIW